MEQKATTALCVGRDERQIDESLHLASRVGIKSGRNPKRAQLVHDGEMVHGSTIAIDHDTSARPRKRTLSKEKKVGRSDGSRLGGHIHITGLRERDVPY